MATQEHTPGSPELSVAKTDVEAPFVPEMTPFLYLEIRRGRTGYPQRPVMSRDFLIGSGPGCDLRLGGGEIPAAHSLLVVRENEVKLQWLAESPALLVNGEPAHEAALEDGDQIGIGRFEFIVRRVHDHAACEDHSERRSAEETNEPLTTEGLLNLLSHAKVPQEMRNVSERSALELVDRLQADHEAIEKFEQSITQGEAALLYAAAQRAEELMDVRDSGLSEPVDADILDELEKVIEQLSGFSAELDERAVRIATQEATQTEAAELLLDAQRELAAQLERFHQQVAITQVTPEPKLRKAA